MESVDDSGFFSCCSTLALVICICTLLYLYEKRRFSVFSAVGIPGPPPFVFIGNVIDFVILGAEKAGEKWTKQYGKIHGLFFGRVPFIHVGDVDVLKDILVKDFDHFVNRAFTDLDPPPVDKGVFFLKDGDWKRVRNIITPSFSSGKLKRMVEGMNRCADTLVKGFANEAECGNVVTVKDHFGAFTMDVIARTAFGLELNSQTDSNNPFVKMAQKAFANNPLQHPAILLMLFFPECAHLLKYLNISFWPQDTREFFSDLIGKLISERKRDPTQRNDFMQLLLNAEISEDTESPALQESDKKKGLKLTTEEIVGQGFIFFIAGYETTASLLQYLAYLLATNDDVQTKLHNAICDNLGDGDLAYDDVMQLQYLDQVVCEALRIHPPLAQMTRRGDKSVSIRGVTLHKDVIVSVPIYRIHHDPDYYPEPDKFDPERFSISNKAKMHPCQFLPFGQGPRNCIGMRLALLEAKIALVHVMRKFKFVTCPETDIPLKLTVSSILQPANPIKLYMQTRN